MKKGLKNIFKILTDYTNHRSQSRSKSDLYNNTFLIFSGKKLISPSYFRYLKITARKNLHKKYIVRAKKTNVDGLKRVSESSNIEKPAR